MVNLLDTIEDVLAPKIEGEMAFELGRHDGYNGKDSPPEKDQDKVAYYAGRVLGEQEREYAVFHSIMTNR